MAKSEKFQVRHGTATITVFPWKHSSGVIHWRYRDQNGKCHTRKDKKKARDEAFALAKRIHAGTESLDALPDATRQAIHRMIRAGFTPALADEFLAWKSRAYPEKPVDEAIQTFLALKEANRGRSIQNLRTLRKHLTPLATTFAHKNLSDVTTGDLEQYLQANPANGNRTRRNIRASIVTFWRWCAKSGFVASADAAVAIERPLVTRSIPETWSPAELRTMLNAVRPEYLPWLVAAAFGGFRLDEISPLAGGSKSPLDWSDFQWARDIVIVRPETDKNGHRRVVPILPALRAYLFPLRVDKGPILASPPPQKLGRGKGAIAETRRLGALVGGWRKNALRHSWISYRAAVVGLAQAAMEAGNSESQARRAYNDAKSPKEAEEWFSLRPKRTSGNCRRK